MTEKQAEAVVGVVSDSHASLVTRSDLDLALSRQTVRLIWWQVGMAAWITAMVVAMGAAVLANLP